MDAYSVGLAVFFCLVVLGVVKGWGDNRSIVVFRDYDDLGLTFLIPVSFILISLAFSLLGGSQVMGHILGGAVALGLFSVLVKNSYYCNNRDVSKAFLAVITKMPLGIFWVLNLVQALNPSGRGIQRSRNRGQAILVLALLTPIISVLVVDKTGSYFNPKGWIKGRRIGSSIRNSL